jgi:enoyl reductase
VVFLKDSGQATYRMTVTVTWKIRWTGTGHPEPTALPTGTFESHEQIAVGEIQSVTR